MIIMRHVNNKFKNKPQGKSMKKSILLVAAMLAQVGQTAVAKTHVKSFVKPEQIQSKYFIVQNIATEKLRV